MPPRIHVALNVTDLPAAVAFYRAMLGAGPVREVPDFAKFVVDEPPLDLALSAAPQVVPGPAGAQAPEPVGVLSHLGIALADDAAVVALAARWRLAGLQTREGAGYGGELKFWVYDPEGNEWEVFAG